MPTATFFNLPQEKKEKIFHAIQQELTEKSLEDVSINQIIKHAGISRGSFYQYFEDKQDMVRYMLEEFRKIMNTYIETNLERYGGDVFQVFRGALDDLHGFVVTKDNVREMHLHLLADKDVHELFCSPQAKNRIVVGIVNQLSKYADSYQTCEAWKDNAMLMVEMLFDIAGRTIMETFMAADNQAVYEAEAQKYQRKIDLIRRGFLSLGESDIRHLDGE